MKYSIKGTPFIDKPNCFCQSIYVKKNLKTRKEQKRKNIQGGSLYEPRIQRKNKEPRKKNRKLKFPLFILDSFHLSRILGYSMLFKSMKMQRVYVKYMYKGKLEGEFINTMKSKIYIYFGWLE